MTPNALRAAAEKAAAARQAADHAQDELNDAIREAMKSPDMKTIEIAEITGLTRARVYQIRDRRR